MSDRDRDYRARSRSRSRSPSRRDRDRNLKNRDKKSSSSSRRRDYSSASEEDVDLQAKFGVEEISQDDYFSKSNEFRAWLRDEKKKYLDQLSGEESRRYFKKFVKVWNRGRLSSKHYLPASSTSSSAASQTSYKWSIRSDASQLASARSLVDSATNLKAQEAAGLALPAPRVFGGRVVGPAMPPGFGVSSSVAGMSEADRVLSREEERSRNKEERKRERKRETEEAHEGRSGGREGRIEKRKEINAENRQMRNRSPGGLEIDESTLLGSSTQDSFAARIAARDRAQTAANERRQQAHESRRAAVAPQASGMAAKNAATMDMLKALAREKFGGP